MRPVLLILAFAPLLPGCLLSQRTQNERLAAQKLAALVPGTTTARETVEILGAPTEIVQLGKRSAYRYDHTATKDTGVFLLVLGLFNSDTRADRAWVFFDENEVLTHVASSLRAKHVQYAVPWQDIHDDPRPVAGG